MRAFLVTMIYQPPNAANYFQRVYAIEVDGTKNLGIDMTKAIDKANTLCRKIENYVWFCYECRPIDGLITRSTIVD